MKFGTFHLPYSVEYADGKRAAKDVIDWDLQVVEWADKYGLAEAFFAEHYTVGAEPSPAPDVMIAAASQRTSQIRLGAGAHLLPYHNPVALAHRIMWLDHMTGGRYIVGVAPGAYPTDAQLFGTGQNNPEMMIEAIEIMQAIWTRTGPFKIDGKYWSVDMPDYDPSIKGPHLKPLQTPHPPITMTGMRPQSPTLTVAGERGFAAASQQLGIETVLQHWVAYEQAATEAGHAVSKADWRIFRDFFVADTDEEARDAVLNGTAGKIWESVLLPVYRSMNLLPLLAGSMDPEKVTVEWLVDNFWLVGSPSTVIEKARAFNEKVGGVGTVISFTYDYSADPEVYRRNFELMGTKVMPELASL